MSKKVLILAGDRAEDYELKVPQQCLQMLGYDVHVTAPLKKAGQTIQLVVHDLDEAYGMDTYREVPGHKCLVDIALEDVRFEKYDLLLIPGGAAPEYIRMHDRVIELVQKFAASGKPVTAICHGIQVLTAAGVIENKNVTCYHVCAPEAKLAGASWTDTDVVVDGNIITARGWWDHPQWLSTLTKILGAKIEI